MQGTLWIDGEHAAKINDLIIDYVHEHVLAKHVLVKSVQKENLRKIINGKEVYVPTYRVEFHEVLDEMAGNK